MGSRTPATLFCDASASNVCLTLRQAPAKENEIWFQNAATAFAFGNSEFVI